MLFLVLSLWCLAVYIHSASNLVGQFVIHFILSRSAHVQMQQTLYELCAHDCGIKCNEAEEW